ncbi:hypothetical protein D3C78_1058260 [compost metagenome]
MGDITNITNTVNQRISNRYGQATAFTRLFRILSDLVASRHDRNVATCDVNVSRFTIGIALRPSCHNISGTQRDLLPGIDYHVTARRPDDAAGIAFGYLCTFTLIFAGLGANGYAQASPTEDTALFRALLVIVAGSILCSFNGDIIASIQRNIPIRRHG